MQNPYTALICSALKECDAEKLGFEEKTMTYGEYLKYSEALEAELVPAQALISGLREVKDEQEILKLKAAQIVAEKAFDELLGIISTDMTEREVASELIYRMLKNGAEDISFKPIVVSGSNSSMPHGVPGNSKLQKNSFTTLDFGCILAGYCSDMTRTIAFGSVTEEMKRVYDTVLEAQEAGIAAARAGVTGTKIDAAARRIISEAGYGEYFGHGFGHGLGLEIHENPSAAPSWPYPIKAGAVISAEPGIYLPGKFGVRIEDVIVIKEDGCENITRTNKALLSL